jgi:hypothetical protein
VHYKLSFKTNVLLGRPPANKPIQLLGHIHLLCQRELQILALWLLAPEGKQTILALAVVVAH